ncbi:MAG: LIC11966 family surface protein, partial [Bacteroidia bacterium]
AAKSLEESKKIGPFDDKKEFSDVAVEYFTTINSIANNEGKEMVETMSKDSTQFTQTDVDHIRELAVKFDDSYAKVYDKIKQEQLNFSKKWKFALIEK